VTVTFGAESAATVSGVALIVAALGNVGTLGSAGTFAPLALGTVLVAAVAAGAVTDDDACSVLQAIHSRVATISQAKIRKVRVWFMGKGSWRRVGSADARARH
jgi:hypothetical protein